MTDPNPVLFSQYADHHRGICLEFEAEDDSIIHRVNYDAHTKYHKYSEVFLNFINEQYEVEPKKQALQPFLHKHDSWSYQKEARIFNLDGPRTTKKMEDLKLKLTKIIFGLRVDKDVRIAIKRSALDHKNVEYFECMRPAIKDGPYWALKADNF